MQCLASLQGPRSGSYSLWSAMQVTGRGLRAGGCGRERNRVPGALQQAENVLWLDMAVTAKVFTVPQIHCLRCTPVLT